MSSSEFHAALKRCSTSGLYNEKRRRVLKPALAEFLIHGLKYVFPTQPGSLVRGMPTAHSAQPLKDLLVTSDRDVYVWAFGSGKVKGQELLSLRNKASNVEPSAIQMLSNLDQVN